MERCPSLSQIEMASPGSFLMDILPPISFGITTKTMSIQCI